MNAMGSDLAGGGTKHSYTIPCSSVFREAIEALAQGRGVNVGDIARSVLLVIPLDVIAEAPDPGEPPSDDRELVVLKSGPSEGRPWRRKPRLQVRMAPGFKVLDIRKALGLALALEQGNLRVQIFDPSHPPSSPPHSVPPAPAQAQASAHLQASAQAPAVEPTVAEPRRKERRSPGRRNSDKREAEALRALESSREETDRLRATISVLAFEPLDEGVISRSQALHVLGFPPGTRPDGRSIRLRFRMLATIHHPDSNFGDHIRMSQLNQAMEILRDDL
jgi:hypothetical protein